MHRLNKQKEDFNFGKLNYKLSKLYNKVKNKFLDNKTFNKQLQDKI